MTMADTIAVMNGGRVEQLGPPNDLYERPQTAFVAGFLGVSNLLPGTVAGPDTIKLDGGSEVKVALRRAAGPVRPCRRRHPPREDPDRHDSQLNALTGKVFESRVRRRLDPVRRRHAGRTS